MSGLDRLLRPKSVAVIGGDPAERVIRRLDDLGYDGAVWPVHPSRAAMAGRDCRRAIADLPAAPDAAFVAVPRGDVPEVVAGLREADTGGAVVYSSGFAESGDVALQEELVAAAGDMPLLGPNCYGFVNALDGTAVWPDVHGLRRVERGVAIVTQSGNIGINVTMARRSLDVGLVVTVGNQAVLDIPTLVDTLLGDPRITAIGVQFEGTGDGPALGRAALRAADLGVSLVALKMGASARGAVISASHTGSMVGEDDAYDALFRRYGIARVHSIPAFLEALKLAPLERGATRIVSLSASGGEAAHVADLAHRSGLELPELAPDHVARIAATVDPLVTVSNPMDYHTFSWGDEARKRRTFAAVVDGSFDLAMLVLDFPAGDVPEEWWAACRAFAAAVGDLPGLVVATLPEAMPEVVQARIREMGLVPMLGIAETIDAVAALAVAPAIDDVHLPPRPIIGAPRTLDEAASKEMLADTGIAVPGGVVTDDPLPAPLPYPITVKVLGIDHKADAGAVAVGVRDAAELADVVAAMPVGRYLVEETVDGGLAELLVSLRTVAGIGWLLTVGTGGSQVEVIDDHAHLLVPATRTEIAAAVGSLRGATANVGAVVDAVVALQSLVSVAGVIEAEVNPLIVLEDGAVAVDAMVTVSDA